MDHRRTDTETMGRPGHVNQSGAKLPRRRRSARGRSLREYSETPAEPRSRRASLLESGSLSRLDPGREPSRRPHSQSAPAPRFLSEVLAFAFSVFSEAPGWFGRRFSSSRAQVSACGRRTGEVQQFSPDGPSTSVATGSFACSAGVSRPVTDVLPMLGHWAKPPRGAWLLFRIR
jgi:hypothetical protein